MPTFNTAQELLQPGQTGMFVHTDGRHFTYNADGSGSTGFWVINPSRQVDRVVVVLDEFRRGKRIVELFTARHDGVVGPKDGRYTVKLIDVQLAGSTDRTWKEFANAGQNPVRYISKLAHLENALWLNVDKPLKSLILHFRGGCTDEHRKGRGRYKPVGELGRDGGWLPFPDYSAALRYTQHEWRDFPPLRYCSNCSAAVSLSDLGDYTDDEGGRNLVTHHRIERSSKMVAAKRKAVLAVRGALACEVCRFDFLQFYGPVGLDYCEVHHLTPLADLTQKQTTRLEDLAIVCSNCHRMLHRGRPCFTIHELKQQLRESNDAYRMPLEKTDVPLSSQHSA